MTLDLDKRLAGLSPEKRALLERKLKQKAAEKAREKVRKQHIPPRQGEGPWPASMDQTALWFFHQVDTEFYAYNNGPTLQITGPLNIPVLESAATELLRRHEILRTIFHYRDGTLYQTPVKDPKVTCPLLDLSNEPGETLIDRAHEEVTRLFREPFDLGTFPLIRFNLIKLGEDDYLMPLVAHHAIIDWWTLKLIPKELLTIYHAYLNGQPSPLPELPVQFIDYTLWRNNWLASEDFQKQMDYWLDQLKGAPLVLDLPKDRPRPTQQDFTGERLYRRMPQELLEGIRRINIRMNASSLMTCMAGTFAFLSRYSGQKDLLIGTPTTDRERKELENMAGYMLNVLIVRADLTEDPTFAEFVGQMKRTILDALAHKELPFRMLVEKLSPERNLAHMPIYQVDFNHVAIDGPVFETHKKQGAGISLPGYEVNAFPMDRGISDVDLQINYDEGLNEGRIVMEWAAALFNTDTAEHMGDLLVRLFTNLTQNPDTPISCISWLTEEEKHDLLVTWNGSVFDYPRDISIGNLTAQRAAQSPKDIAVVHGAEQLSFGELNTRADRIAAYLIDQGIGLCDPVGLCLNQGFDWVAAMLGILRAGGAYVPLDATYPQERISYMLEDTGMTTLITHSEMMDSLPAHELNFLNLLVMDEDADMLESYEADAPDITVPAESPAYIIYTSGTTGQPKGVVVPHRAVARLVFDTEYVAVTPGDGIAQASNISFDAHVFEVFTALIHGGRLCIVEKDTFLNAEALAAQIAEQKIVTMFMTTALFNQFARDKPDLFADMKYVLFGGERVDPETVRRILESGVPKNLLHVYGPTETTTYASWHPVEAVAEDAHNIPIGGPIANTRIYLLDQGMELAPVGVVGELCIAGDALAHGYHGDAAKTAERFVPNPFAPQDRPGDRIYRTGDLVRRLRSGAIEFHGRRDNQVKLRGFRIELGEIETALTHHEAVAEALAIIRQDENKTKRIYAYVCPHKGEETSSIDVPAVRAHLTERLPEYMLPTAVVVLQEFPLTPNGKIDQRALPDPDFQAEASKYTAPRNEVETRLCEIWAALLNQDRVGIHDNFFELGGDSILGIQAVAAANRAGLPLSTKHLFQFQTIAELAEQVGSVTAVVAEQGTITGEVPLTPIQSWFLNRGRKFPHHFNIGMHLEASQALNPETLKQALERVTAHHDALRMRFRDIDGVWHQINDDLEGNHFGFTHADMSGEVHPVEALIQLADTKQSALNLADGPLVQVILAEMDPSRKQRLIVIVHHLVFDGISSRVLMEDLETIYKALEQGAEPRLMPKSTSWKYWAERMSAFARSEEILAEIPWWESQVKGPAAVIPFNADAPNTAGSSRSIYVGLNEEETRQLLQEVPSVYNTRINDLLLCSLAMAVAESTGTKRVRIALEGHGREELFDDVDFSRTFGWFTAMFPVLLDLEGLENDSVVLKAVKEQIRRIPRNGLGYGLLRWVNPDVGDKLEYEEYPQLNINYLGQFGGGSGGSAGLLDFSTDTAGHEHAPGDDRGYHFEIVGVTVKDKLNLFYNYSGEVIAEDVAQDLADRHIAKLRQLIAHCLEPGTGGRTPSDFPYVSLSQAMVDKLTVDYPDMEAIYPAMGLQAGMLFHSLMEPESTVYKQQLSMFLPGKLNVDNYRRAWQQVIDRHESLRTLFLQTDQGFLQIVLKDFEPHWTLGEVASRDDFQKILADNLAAPMELHTAPASRFSLYSLGDKGHYFIWSHHHVNLDGWSIPIVLEEVSAGYQALMQGVEAELPPAASCEDYVRWYRKQDMDEARAHWQKLLDGYEEPTLLAQKPPEADKIARVEAVETTLSGDTSSVLEQFARANGLTMSTLFQASWALALSRYLDRDDVAFGVTGSGRPPELKDVERLVGMFLNTLPLRTRLEPDKPVLTWLEELQGLQVEGRQFEYSVLAEIQQLADVPAGQPLFDSIVVYENYPVDTSLGERFGGEGIGDMNLFEESNFPITLQSGPGKHVLLRIRYDTNRFSESFVNGLLQHVAGLMSELPVDPNRPLGALPMLTADQLTALQSLAGDTSDYARDRGIVDRFADIVAKAPGDIALVSNGQHTTYGELANRAGRIAHRLRAMGVRIGHTVAVSLAEDDPDLIAAFLGILTAGAAYVPLDPELPEARLKLMIDDAAPTCIIGDLNINHGLPPASLEALDDLPNTRPSVKLDADLPAYIMYTSGSTGTPKGVVVPHRGIIRLVCDTEWIQFRNDDVVLQTSIPGFDAATFEIWGALLHGARLVLMSSRDIENIPERVLSEGVTVIYLNAQLFNLMVDSGLRERGALRLVMTGGDAASPGHVARFREAFPGLTLLNGYGPTENTTFTTTFELSAYSETDTPIGRPVTNSTVYVLDRYMRPLPVEVAGELMTGGDGLALGYLNRPAQTAASFVPDPFSKTPGSRLYRTGDLASLRANGVLDFLGRRDHQVKIRGFRIELGEIEQCLRVQPGVEDALVRLRVTASGDKRLLAWVVKPGADGDREEEIRTLRDALAGKLPGYMVPAAIAPVGALPLKPNGKLDMAALPDPEDSGDDYTPPETPTQETVAAVWARLLEVPRISIHANFFEMGAHSLMATRAVSMLRSALDVQLPIKALFDAPTTEKLAHYIDLMLWTRDSGPEDEEDADQSMMEGEI
ncbi:MAG: amino acid adenylation domain-containing protein [Acidobacteriota bacterium]|nr:amino acid adenylation domain-containing protein [Acidobacteriota bacterium]